MYAVPSHAVKNTSWVSRFFKGIKHIQKSSFSLTIGLRAAAFVIAPIIIGFVIQQPALSLVALGAIFLTNIEKLLPNIPSQILLLACFTEAASFGLGTLAATTTSILPYFTWNCSICSSCRLVQYKVGGCWYVCGNNFRCRSGFTWLFNTISQSEDTFFSYRNVMGAAGCRDSTLCSIAQNTTTIEVGKCGK